MCNHIARMLTIVGLFTSSLVHAQTDTIWSIDINTITVQADNNSPKQAAEWYLKHKQNAGLEDILSKIPGVNLTARGPYGMEPMVRGMSGGQTTILIDGMHLHGACTDRMDPSTIYIEPVNLESISVKTDDGSAMLASTPGGLVQMKLKEAQTSASPAWSLGLGSRWHSNAPGIHTSANIDYAAPKWGIRFSGVHRKVNNYTDGSGQKIALSRYEKANGHLNVVYKPSSKYLLKLDFIGDFAGFIGYPALPMDVGYAQAYIGAITYKQLEPKGKWNGTEFKLYANTVIHAMDDTKRDSVPMHMDMPGWSSVIGAYAQSNLVLSDKTLLSLRADASSTKLKAEMTMYVPGENPMFMLTWPENRQSLLNIAVQAQHMLNNKLSVYGTARIGAAHQDVLDDFGASQFEVFNYDVKKVRISVPFLFELGTKYFSKHWEFSLSAQQGSRAPTASELYGFYLFNALDAHDYIGNPDLKNESFFKVEGKAQFKSKYFNIMVKPYWQHLNQYIYGESRNSWSAMTIGAAGVRQFVNYSSAQISGFEAGLSGSLRKFLSYYIASSYTRAQFEDGSAVPFISPLQHNIGVSFQWKGFRALLDQQWALAQNRYNPYFGEDATPAWWRLSLRMSYKHKIGKAGTLEWQVGAENLTNASYYTHTDWQNLRRPGRGFYAGLSWSY